MQVTQLKNDRMTWFRILGLTIAFVLVDGMGNISFLQCQQSLEQNYPNGAALKTLYIASIIFECIGAFFAFILVKLMKDKIHIMNSIATTFIFPIHYLCYYYLQNTNPDNNAVDEITAFVYFCYLIHGLGSGLLFATVLSMVGLLAKPQDTGKSYSLFFSFKVVQLLFDMGLNTPMFYGDDSAAFQDFKGLSFTANTFGLILFCVISNPRIKYNPMFDSNDQYEQNQDVTNFFFTLKNVSKLIPLLIVYETFEYFNEYYYFREQVSNEFFSNVLKILWTVSPLIIAGEWFDSSSRVSSFGYIHVISLVSVFFMYFEIKQEQKFLDWLLILFLSASYITIPVLLTSWIRFFYRDDVVTSFSIFGTAHGLTKIIVYLFIGKPFTITAMMVICLAISFCFLIFSVFDPATKIEEKYIPMRSLIE